MNVIPHSISNEVIDAVSSVLRKKRLFRYDCDTANESETSRLEEVFSTQVGSQYCVAMNSCSSTLFVALLCAGVKPGDKVAIPAFTFIAVPSSVVHANCKPVLIEIDNNYNIDLNDLVSKVRTQNIKYLLMSYMRGRVPNIDEVMSICEEYGVSFIEDAAHSLGVLWKGKQTGTFGVAGGFSTQSYKMLDGGEGGLFVTDDEDIAYKAMLLSGCYERNWKKHFMRNVNAEKLNSLTNTLPAYNFRMSNLSASALIPQINNIDNRVDYFTMIYSRFENILSSNKYIEVPEFEKNSRPAPDSIQWRFKNIGRDDIKIIQSKLHDKGIKFDLFSNENARCFWNWSFLDVEDCPRTREILSTTADLRLGTLFSIEDADRVAADILSTIDSTV